MLIGFVRLIDFNFSCKNILYVRKIMMMTMMTMMMMMMMMMTMMMIDAGWNADHTHFNDQILSKFKGIVTLIRLSPSVPYSVLII